MSGKRPRSRSFSNSISPFYSQDPNPNNNKQKNQPNVSNPGSRRSSKVLSPGPIAVVNSQEKIAQLGDLYAQTNGDFMVYEVRFNFILNPCFDMNLSTQFFKG